MGYPRVTTWMYGVLTAPPIAGVSDSDGVTGGAVFEDDAPQLSTDADSVWIVFEIMSPGQDVAVVGDQRVWTEFAFLVRAVARTRSTKALESVAKEIDTRLDRASGASTGAAIVTSFRVEEHQDKWFEQGVEYRALGGQYNVIVQPA